MALTGGAVVSVTGRQVTPVCTARGLRRRGAPMGAAVLKVGLTVAAVAFAVWVIAAQSVRSGVPGHPVSVVRHRAGAELPVAAQGPVSRIVGQDDPSYRAARTRAGIELRSPRQHLDATFTRHGVSIRSGHASLRLSLRGYGYGGSLRAVGAVAPVAQANRVDFRRGAVDEWYASGPLGLEQGFMLQLAPVAAEMVH